MEALLVCDASHADLYVRSDHRVHGPRRALLRSDEAYDEDEMPGERFVEPFEAGESLPPGALEELEEYWYFQDQMAKDD